MILLTMDYWYGFITGVCLMYFMYLVWERTDD